MGQHKFNPRALAAAQGQTQTQVNLDDLAVFACPICKSDLFEPAYRIHEIPELMRALANGNNVVQVQMWRCCECGRADALDRMAKLTADERKARLGVVPN